MKSFTCTRCQKKFTTDQQMVRQWPIEKWWLMVGRQCANCRVEAQGEPKQTETRTVAIPAPRQPADDQIVPAHATTMKGARAQLMLLREEGVRCPCCDQYAKVYKRRVNSGMARALILMYKSGGITEYVHTPSLLGGLRGEEARLSYWGLTKELEEAREDGGRRGWWKVTRRGELFVQNEITIPSHARVYNSQCLGLVGDPIRITDALGKKFDLRDLMSS